MTGFTLLGRLTGSLTAAVTGRPGAREATAASELPASLRWLSTDLYESAQLIEHLDGVPWWKAPIPPKRHNCTPQTRALLHDVERCACGALQFRHGPGSGVWGERNSRTAPGTGASDTVGEPPASTDTGAGE